ncbi:glycoside hydrolase family 172 protein [Bacteroides sp.]|uniref:glycoside hydrolase family 172 protein n=1 Tax=Bacteroides sp. TaxID=29523 RepID=UPI0026166E85|nr:glycoside hydrolase family 172 protein [Bacteroides sp.]
MKNIISVLCLLLLVSCTRRTSQVTLDSLLDEMVSVEESARGLLQPHTSYTPDGKGGSTLFLPIPFAKGCKITFEDEVGITATPKYYHINYRKYPKGTLVETFSDKVVADVRQKIVVVDNLLLHPEVKTELQGSEKRQWLQPGDSICIDLPQGENAVYEVNFEIGKVDSTRYAQLMRNLIFMASFDSILTVWVPLSDYSGGGMGAPAVQSWFLSADGHGKVISRWLMPYQKGARLSIRNISTQSVDVNMKVMTAPLQWGERSLYFHASWRQQNQLPVYDHPDEDRNCKEWNFATLTGRGVYKGDVLTLFNHSRAWYGEGDEKIWVDADTFPSHFGTGTEDYYNSSWAPVVIFHTPFGGAPRADQQSSHGYNTFFRTRNLDGIPFSSKLQFDIELLSWIKGTVDYATTVYWYGDAEAKAVGTSGEDEAAKELLPIPVDISKYHRENSIEFEDLG